MIEYLDECDSTQTALIEGIKATAIKPPYAIVAKSQSKGVGSRGNSWESQNGNLYFSFCVDKSALTADLPEISASIYFAYLMKIYLSQMGSKVWLKWPNDFYLDDKKIGGVMTNKIGNIYVCGMGINLVSSPDYSDVLDISVSPNSLVNGFCEILEMKYSWKEILSKFFVEFEKSKNFSSHVDGQIISLETAVLCNDGSIEINGKKVYSIR